MPSIILSDNGVSSGSAGIKTTGANDGTLVLQTTTSGGTATTAVTLDNSQNATFAGTMTAPTAAITGSLNAPNTFGFKNRIINGGMTLAQRGTSATVTAGTGVPTASTGYPCVDRFFVYSTGANVTAAQVAGSGSTQYRFQITGAASVTAVGVGQRIEQANSYDLAGSTCTLSVDLANSLLTTVTWTASYATTADTFGTIGTPTKTQIATGTFTVTSTVTNYSTQISVPSAATTGIEILFTVGAQTSGTWTIGNVQFEKGAVATSFDFRDYGTELALCQRYYETLANFNQTFAANTGYNTNGVQICLFHFKVTKRASATLIGATVSGTNMSIYSSSTGANTQIATVAAYMGTSAGATFGSIGFNSTGAAVAEL